MIVVMLLNKRVCIKTVVTFRTGLSLLNKTAHIIVIKVSISLTIFGIMVVNTMLKVMFLGNVTWSYFKDIQV